MTIKIVWIGVYFEESEFEKVVGVLKKVKSGTVIEGREVVIPSLDWDTTLEPGEEFLREE